MSDFHGQSKKQLRMHKFVQAKSIFASQGWIVTLALWIEKHRGSSPLASEDGKEQHQDLPFSCCTSGPADAHEQDLPPYVRDIIDVFTNQVVLRNTSEERKKKEGCHKFNNVCIFCVFYKAFHKQKHPFLDRWSRCMPTPYLFQTKYALFYLFALFKR